MPYEALFAMEGITYTAPSGDDVHKSRPALYPALPVYKIGFLG